MYREAMKQLEAWKCGLNRKLLVLRGARQVGNTKSLKVFKVFFRFTMLEI